MIPRILLFNDNSRANGLTAALRRRGAMVTIAPLSAVQFNTHAPNGLVFPGIGKRLPDGVLIRSMAIGSFEAITRRLGVLHALEGLGVPVWNTGNAIERCVDKSMTSFLLQAAGLPTPPTFAVEGLEAAQTIVKRELSTGPIVLKPLFGAQGRGLRLIETPEDVPPPEAIADVYYLQRYVVRGGPPFYDFRVFVCAGEAIAMMSRRSTHWITNVNRGGKPEPVEPASETLIASLAVAAAAAVGADFAGVDILPDADGGLLVLEVNSMPAWSGLQSVVTVSIADRIAGSFLAHVSRSHLARSNDARPLRFVSPANR